MPAGFVYIVASKKGGTLYIGLTSNLAHRAHQHSLGTGSKFTAKYGCKRLVWYQAFESIDAAITREKTMKKWPRQWKVNAIEAVNPDWRDLMESLV